MAEEGRHSSTRVLRRADRRMARLVDVAPSPVHRVAPLLRRDRGGARPPGERDASCRHSARVLRRGGTGGARARRAEGPPTQDLDTWHRSWSRSSVVGLVIAVGLGVAGVAESGLGPSAVHRRRAASRCRVQRRDVRGTCPHRRRFCGGLGGFPGAHRVCRPSPDIGTGTGARGCGCLRAFGGATSSEHSGADGQAESRQRRGDTRSDRRIPHGRWTSTC